MCAYDMFTYVTIFPTISFTKFFTANNLYHNG